VNTGLIWDNLLTYSFQIGLVVGLAGFVPSLLRLRWAGAKLIFWQILLAACLLLPLVRPWRREVIAAVGVPVTTSVTIAGPARPAARTTLPRSEMALLLLAAGTLVRLGWLGVGFWRLGRYRRNAQRLGRAVDWAQGPAGGLETRRRLETCPTSYAGRSVTCPTGCSMYLSDEVASPVTFGWRRPVILLPACFPELDGRIQDAILCHELLHVERRDWLFTISEEVVRGIFWFHPAIWWLLGEIQLAREQAVDSLAIERTEARDEYVDALLAIAGAKAQFDLAPAPLFLRKRHLKQRVMSIFKEARMSKTGLISRLAMGVAILAAACWIVTSSLPLAAAPQVVNDSTGVTVDVGAAALLHRAPVHYPESAQKNGVQGTVTVEATLDGSGNVSDARVLSGPDELRKAALQSVLQWHFTGAAAGSSRTVSIGFQLPEASPAPPEKPISPELRAKVAEAKANPPDVEQYVIGLRNGSPAAPRILKSITIMGLSDQMRDELLSRLPVHEGDTLTNESMANVVAAVQAFDEHLNVSTTGPATGQTIVISPSVRAATPDAPSAPNFFKFKTEAGTGVLLVENQAQPVPGPAVRIVRMVHPSYPPEAKAARISGVVKLNAVIAADGTVKNLEVISGHPLLVPAALEAVKQWVYQPPLLNGNPVEVNTEVSVNFTLSE
jgi:TonB family protein